MLDHREYFKGGKVDRDALAGFIKDIKKKTKLSDEDAAVIAASKVFIFASTAWLTGVWLFRWWTRSPSPGCGTGSGPPAT